MMGQLVHGIVTQMCGGHPIAMGGGLVALVAVGGLMVPM